MTNNVLTPSGATALIRTFQSTIGNVPALCCDARELHAYLGNGDKFAGWFKSRVEKYKFEAGQDFEPASKKSEANSELASGNTEINFLISENTEIKNEGRGGDRRSIDYHLTVGMAKELCMVENNDMGRQARRYFLECERLAHEALQKEFNRAAASLAKLPAKHDTLPLRIHLSQHAGLQKFCVSSTDVARDFKINNRTVVRHIKNLKCSQKFHERNFVLSQYQADRGMQR